MNERESLVVARILRAWEYRKLVLSEWILGMRIDVAKVTLPSGYGVVKEVGYEDIRV